MALKVAMLGCGGVARHHHAPAFAKTEGVKIVAACDLIEDRAKALAGDYNVPYYFDAAKMLESEEIDVVDVVTNEVQRPAPLMQCLEAGKHVYCEKPLAGAKGQYNVDEGDLIKGKEIMDVWRKRKDKGQRFGINFNYRTAPHAKPMKEAIDAGEFGDPIMINVFAHLACWSHVIDLMRWFNGDVAELTAYMSAGEHDRDRSATLKFVNGSIGTLVGSCRLNWAQPLLRIEYVGTKARGTIEDLTGEFRIRAGDQPEKAVWGPPDGNTRSNFGETFTHSVMNYAIAVRDGKEPPVTGIDAFRELEIDAAIPMSAARNAPVKIELY